MNDDRELIDKAKIIILSDCLDSFFVSKSDVIKYLKKNKSGYMKFFRGCNSQLSINKAVSSAFLELEQEGKVIKSCGSIRKPYSF